MNSGDKVVFTKDVIGLGLNYSDILKLGQIYTIKEINSSEDRNYIVLQEDDRWQFEIYAFETLQKIRKLKIEKLR